MYAIQISFEKLVSLATITSLVFLSKPLYCSVSDTIIKLVFNVYNFPISDCTKYGYETKINKAEHHKKGNVCLWFVVMSSNLQVCSKKLINRIKSLKNSGNKISIRDICVIILLQVT